MATMLIHDTCIVAGAKL